jgi:hypothetical protein
MFGKVATNILSIDIAVHAFQWFETGQLFRNSGGAEIAGMPYLVAGFKMPEHRFVQEMMCI